MGWWGAQSHRAEGGSAFSEVGWQSTDPSLLLLGFVPLVGMEMAGMC